MISRPTSAQARLAALAASVLLAGPAFAATPAAEGQLAVPLEEGAHGGGGAFPPFDPTHFASQLFWLVLTFGALYFVMQRVLIPRIGGILETRRDRISQDLDIAQRMRDDAEVAQAAYERDLADARKRAAGIAEGAREKAKADADAERQRTEADLGEKLATAEARIASIKADALAQVDRIATETTQAIVQRLVGVEVDAAEAEAAVRATRPTA